MERGRIAVIWWVLTGAAVVFAIMMGMRAVEVQRSAVDVAADGWVPTAPTVSALPTAGATAQGVTSRPTAPEPPPTAAPVATATAIPPPPPATEHWVDPSSVGLPYPGVQEGLLTFRGNPTRTFYGRGPVPAAPAVDWAFPDSGGLCGLSTVGSETTQWCGTGWTGQPAVFDRDGRRWVVFGAYDHDVHFLDGDTGDRILPDFPTGDIIKGSVTVDPDGFPLVYTGSRDNSYRVLAIDGDEPRELWALSADDASGPVRWNNDWDGAGLVIGDHLFLGGENSRWYVVRLNRGYDADGRVVVAPQIVFDDAGWDDELLSAIGDGNVSIESSVAVWADTLYFANSGGLVQGWDIGALRRGETPSRTFRFWTGDDTDASVVVDEEGMLYVGSEWERHNARSREVGQILKLDPTVADDPLVWSVHANAASEDGVWATPALHRDLVIVPTNTGDVHGIDRATGEVRWTLELPGPTWQSPVIVDDVLVQGDCNGVLHGYDVADTTVEPPELWSVEIGGCIESTPAVWDGAIYVGTRAGRFVALR